LINYTTDIHIIIEQCFENSKRSKIIRTLFGKTGLKSAKLIWLLLTVYFATAIFGTIFMIEGQYIPSLGLYITTIVSYIGISSVTEKSLRKVARALNPQENFLGKKEATNELSQSAFNDALYNHEHPAFKSIDVISALIDSYKTQCPDSLFAQFLQATRYFLSIAFPLLIGFISTNDELTFRYFTIILILFLLILLIFEGIITFSKTTNYSMQEKCNRLINYRVFLTIKNIHNYNSISRNTKFLSARIIQRII
jgi:hypothetical protein